MLHWTKSARRPAWPAALAALVCASAALTATSPAGARTVATGARTAAVAAVPDGGTGNATWFTGLGSPYGGCGLPQADIDSQNFVALNVFNTPGDYNSYPRPIAPADAARMGAFDNGLNCGRFVQVTIGDYCTGVNDGATGQPFCRNGSWVSDAYNGATLTMLVADSCADPNAWCRDDPNHLDLAQAALNQFVKNGAPVGDMYPDHWNNRHIDWKFVPAPGYTGDIKIGFLQGAQVYWPVIAVSHLADGIHGVQYYDGSAWQNATMDSDMGQAYKIGPTSSGGRDYQIRVTDASDTLINDGRVYSFSLPSSCSAQCSPAYTPVTYTTSTGGSSGGGTGGGGTGGGGTGGGGTGGGGTGGGTGGSSACKVTAAVSSWSGGMTENLTIANTGSSAINGWSLGFTLPSGQTITSGWSATYTGSSGQITATNVSYNGSLAPGASTSIGFQANQTGDTSAPTAFTLNGAACSTG